MPPSEPPATRTSAGGAPLGSPSEAPGAAPAAAPGALEIRQLEQLAATLEGNPTALLDLLRQLEKLHRTIQDGAFRNSLPSDRNRLYQLLEAMEDKGGWPYIPRLQLRTFMDLLQQPGGRGEEPPAPAEPPLAA